MPTIDPTERPRPLLRRPWTSLDGEWEFAADPERKATPGDVPFDRRIRVPYAPETPASKVGLGRVPSCHYRRGVDVPLDRRRRLPSPALAGNPPLEGRRRIP